MSVTTRLIAVAAFAAVLSASAANSFRVTPYVQHPKPDAMTVMWLAQEAGEARIEYWEEPTPSAVTTLTASERSDLASDVTGGRFTANDTLEYCLAGELAYDLSPESADNALDRKGAWEMPYTVPYQYRVRLTGLKADTLYRYRVTLDGNGATYENRFRTSPDPNAWRGFKFIYFSDSETEPADNADSTGRTSDWSPPGATSTSGDRKYLATQTECYASNLCAAVDFGTELIVMAGDLAQKGSKQCDWDEFWRHNAGPLNDPAGSIPILASPGNHDYWSYMDGGTVATRKYLSYFEYEKNGTAVDADQQERFHRVDYGPVTFIFLDANNGDDSKTDDAHDTNHYISREQSGRHDISGGSAGWGCRAPDFNPGSVQYAWLEEQLKDAQKKSAFTFIVSHQCPFSAGYHGRPNTGTTETLSGQPLRVLLPLMHKYGVDGWLAGHDEMMERSLTKGKELLADGSEVDHEFFVWDMGIAGDGLRGTKLNDNDEFEQYRADVDSPEVYENGVLVEGGKHYGHLEVSIDQDEKGNWRATFDPVYVFFNNDANGKSVYGGVRHYGDKQVRISNRNAGAAPAPQPVTKTHVDISTFVPAKMPQGLLMTFWNGPLSRGFSWQTDTSVTETKLWILKGEYDQDDGNTFATTQGALTEGTCETKTVAGDKEPEDTNVHRVHVENLEPGATYSYRLGGNGHYVYGRFTVKDASSRVTAVNFSDTQGKDASVLFKAEKTAALAARTAGDKVDLVIFGGDLMDVGVLKNADHVRYGATVPNSANTWECLYWKWGLMAEILSPYFRGIPWIMSPGNHDYKHYRDMTAVDYFKTGMSFAGCSSVDVGNVHFVELPFLGTYQGGVIAEYTAAFNWLEADLRASSAQWKVVCVHWGPYTTGDHGTGLAKGDNTAEGVCDMVRALTPILSRNHVDLVLQAHDHVFSKSVPYRWDTDGYTSSVTDETVLNLDPETVRFGGELWDSNPAGTYYVSAGCAGPRAAEEPDYPTAGGSKSYTRRDPKIVMGKIAVDSKYRNVGDEATGDFHDKSAAGFQMFGILKVVGDRLAYDFYVAEEDGSVTLVDKLRISKASGDADESGFLLLLK